MRRVNCCQCQPLYTARELKHQLVDAGSTVLVVMDNFCTTVQQIIADTPIKQVITTELGDLLDFPKRSLINFAVKHIKKLVPEYQLPRSIRFREALALGSKHSMLSNPHRKRRFSFSTIHRRHNGDTQRRNADPQKYGREYAAGVAVAPNKQQSQRRL